MRIVGSMRLLALLCLLVAAPAGHAEPVDVDMQLVLAVDISQSMSAADLAIQRQGYAEALIAPEVLDVIRRGYLGQIGLTYVEWSDAEKQRVLVPWTLIDGPAAAENFGKQILAETGGTQRNTSISSGLLFAAHQFDFSPFASSRQVIDISGDGPNNDGLPVAPVRDAVVARGVTINGLPLVIPGRDPVWFLPDLDIYYRDCVIGGPGAFVLPAKRWQDFAGAIREKFVLEIASVRQTLLVPEKAALVTGYDCLVGEKILRRRRGR